MPQIQHTDYYSHVLGKSLKLEVTGHYGYPIIMFPTSKGSYTQNADFHLNGSIANLVDQGKVKLYNIETIDEISLYNKSIGPDERIRRYELYVQFLIQEFVPYIQKVHQTHRVAVAGASFGGYHASNFAFRFPDVVSHLLCLSGAFTIRNFMDGYESDKVYFNCPREFVKNDEAFKYKHMNIVLSTSDQDICLEQTREMAGILASKGISHWYDEQKWINHDWPLWRMVFPKFIGRFFG
ncbi:alpha/beta hydrolase-fold protein [Halpernia frigidisoli]|uniref:Esterase/lipase superfamily enzyme n=1 Tax=Halpernia frigidisoli TaxID=1125876 RepID=A0A1I3ECK0_9FLAO|nr:alpha/beta hydrolase-fold protein [Halpernia frigidisoli]SFH96421.1 Esterase/lipase superfamily enzyme [Halpernia frigidisoli]